MKGALIVGLIGLGLAACQETASAPASDATALAPTPFVKREGVSIADATVAVVSLDGAPDAAAQDFRDALGRAFTARGIVVGPGNKARYRLRVYLAARPDDGGASLDYVVDVYDAARIRRARLSDAFAVKGSGDAWSLMSSEAVGAVAAACADNVAGFLSNAPEAKLAQALSPH
jgi:ABC-type glycerol-3-phosphate transport system substrate-binding protein